MTTSPSALVRLLRLVMALVMASLLPVVLFPSWSGADAPPAREALGLTEEETAFLQGKVLRLGVDASRLPFESLDAQGRYEGISAEYLKAAAARLGVSIAP